MIPEVFVEVWEEQGVEFIQVRVPWGSSRSKPMMTAEEKEKYIYLDFRKILRDFGIKMKGVCIHEYAIAITPEEEEKLKEIIDRDLQK